MKRIRQIRSLLSQHRSRLSREQRVLPRTRRIGTYTLLLVITIGAVCGGILQLQTDTRAESFLPSGDSTLQSLSSTAHDFGSDPIVAIAEGDKPRELLTPDQLPRLVRLEGQLAHLPNVAAVYGPGTTLNQVAISSQDLLADLSGRRDALRSSAQAQAREQHQDPTRAGDAAIASFDQRYGALLAQGMPAGLPTLKNPAFVNKVLFNDQGAPRTQWRFVVPNGKAISILVRPRAGLDQVETEQLVGQVRAEVQHAQLSAPHLTVTGSPALAASLGEQVRKETPLLGGLSVAIIAGCYLLVPWLGSRWRRLLPLTATLGATAATLAVFGWLGRPVSLGVIAFLPILVGIGSDFPAYLAHGRHRRPILITALASSAGFAALAVSPLPFVRDLGLALAMGVLLAAALAVAMRRYLTKEGPSTHEETVVPQELIPRRRRMARVGTAVVIVIVAAAGWIALPGLQVRASPDRLAAGLPAVADAEYAQNVLGSSGEVSIVLRGGNVLTPQALDWSRRAHDAVVTGYGDELRPVVSLPDLLHFLGPSPTQEQISAGTQLLPPYLTTSVLSHDRHSAVLRWGVKLQDLQQQQRLIDSVRAKLPPPPPGMEADVVGLPVAAARGVTLISQERYLTNLLGIALAGTVLLIGLRPRTVGLRAILAAVLATGWSLAIAWTLGLALTPLTAALGSLATGTAFEFTVLLSLARGGGPPRLRRTVAVTALAATAGSLTLTVSGLAVIREFGLLLAGTVALSLLAARLVVWLIPPTTRPAPALLTDRTTQQKEVTV